MFDFIFDIVGQALFEGSCMALLGVVLGLADKPGTELPGGVENKSRVPAERAPQGSAV